jgi:hypothetical protein
MSEANQGLEFVKQIKINRFYLDHRFGSKQRVFLSFKLTFHSDQPSAQLKKKLTNTKEVLILSNISFCKCKKVLYSSLLVTSENPN